MDVSETALESVPNSNIDYLFEIDPFENGKLINATTPLPEVAAVINGYMQFIVGPENGEMSHGEAIKFAMEMEGEDLSMYLSRLVIGTPNTDIKQDVSPPTKQDPALKMVEVLKVIDEYDEEFAEQLIPYLGHELLVERQPFNNKSLRVVVRTDEEVNGSIEQLKALAEHSSGKEREYYTKLASNANLALGKYMVDRTDIVAQAAEVMAHQRKARTRVGRFAFRVAAAACFAVAATSLNAASTDTGSDGVKVHTSAISQEVNTDLKVANRMMDTGNDQSVISQSVLALISQNKIRANELSEDVIDNSDRALVNKLDSLLKDADNALIDNNIDDDELSSINEANINIQELSVFRSGTEVKVTSAILTLAYGAFGFLALWAASRTGGRRDPKIKTYKTGNLTANDSTPSAAVNSSKELPQYNHRTSKN